jgi:hypothetical protein
MIKEAASARKWHDLVERLTLNGPAIPLLDRRFHLGAIGMVKQLNRVACRTLYRHITHSITKFVYLE